MASPRRALGFFDVFCLGLNAIVGTGIFVFPGELYALVGPASVLAFVATAALLSTVALCYAELGGMFRGSGASYVYAREAFGIETGFAMGWLSWAAAVLSLATVAAGLSSQLAYFSPAFSGVWMGKGIAAAGLAAFGWVNYRGVRPGARAVDALTAAKLVPLLVFVAAGAARLHAGRFRPLFSGEGRFPYAVFLCLWALQGFEVAPVPAGETDDPERAVPWAVVGSLLAAGALYAAIQIVAVGAYPLLGRGERPLADAAGFLLGPWGGGLLAAGGVVSMLGFIAGDALGSPRYLAALGERDFPSARLGEFHPRWQTPHRAIVWSASAGILLILSFDFLRLVDLSNLAVVSQYLSTCLAFCVLRRARPDAPRAFRAPLGWIVGPAGCLISLWLMTQVSLAEAGFCAGILAAGFALRALTRRRA